MMMLPPKESLLPRSCGQTRLPSCMSSFARITRSRIHGAPPVVLQSFAIDMPHGKVKATATAVGFFSP
jgi:hypothetical protein